MLLVVANWPAFADRCPHQSVPVLVSDQGRDLASDSTFYRVLHAANQLARHGRPKALARPYPVLLVANGPKQRR